MGLKTVEKFTSMGRKPRITHRSLFFRQTIEEITKDR